MVQVKFILRNGEIMTVDGEEGNSVMLVASHHSVPGISSECGGCLSCGTCHAYLAPEFMGRVAPAAATEVEMLDFVIDPQPNSRLTCQVILTPELDGITFTVPEPSY